MNITDFNRKPTASELNESAHRQFGQKLNLEKFTTEQLHDARNKLRTEVSQFETSKDYNSIHESESYQKSKIFLDVLNKAIEERETIVDPKLSNIEKMVLAQVKEGLIKFSDLPAILQEKAKSKKQQKFFGMVHAAQKGEKPASKKVADVAKNISKKEAKKFASTKRKGLPEKVKSKKNESRYMNESYLYEGEEEKAELIISTKSMTEKIASWMEDAAQMQSETTLDLADSIRDEMGVEQSQEFESIVKPALASIYSSMDASRKQLIKAVELLTGEGEMGGMGQEGGLGDLGGSERYPGEEMPGATIPGGETPGEEQEEMPGEELPKLPPPEEVRAKRESIDFGRRLGMILSSKKK